MGAGSGLFNGKGLIFPGQNGKQLSDMALTMILRRLEIPATVHGMRSTFRDWAAENSDVPREIAEHALAHVEGSAAELAYRRTDYLDKRRELMQDVGRFRLPDIVISGSKSMWAVYSLVHGCLPGRPTCSQAPGKTLSRGLYFPQLDEYQVARVPLFYSRSNEHVGKTTYRNCHYGLRNHRRPSRSVRLRDYRLHDKRRIDAALHGGKYLLQAEKSAVQHGDFAALLERAELHERTAQRWMQLARAGWTAQDRQDVGGINVAASKSNERIRENEVLADTGHVQGCRHRVDP